MWVYDRLIVSRMDKRRLCSRNVQKQLFTLFLLFDLSIVKSEAPTERSDVFASNDCSYIDSSSPTQYCVDPASKRKESYECFNFKDELHTKEDHTFFNTKTTYLNSRGVLHARWNGTFPVPEDCRPIYLHFLNRHSIRFPSQKHIKEFDKNLDKFRLNIIKNNHNDLSLTLDFIKWKLRMDPNDDNLVTTSGRFQTALTG